MLTFFLFFGLVSGQGTTRYAQVNGLSTGSCLQMFPGCSFLRALEASSPFDTILVGPGSFVQGGTVKNKNITIQGSGSSGSSASVLMGVTEILVWGNASVVIQDVRFEDGAQQYGSVAMFPGAVVDVTRCVFSKMQNSGIRIAAPGIVSTLTVSQTTFIDGYNTVDPDPFFAGGVGIRVDGDVNLRIHQCAFVRNACYLTGMPSGFHRGCALYVEPPGASTVTITSTIFDSNSALYNGPDFNTRPEGGAVYIVGVKSLVISDSFFVNNTCRSWGGALVIGSTSATITNTLFRGNSFVGDNSAVGGAVYIKPFVSVAFTRATFRGNFISGTQGTGSAVGLGGDGVAVNNDTVTFQDCFFLSNGLPLATTVGAVALGFTNVPFMKVAFVRPYFCQNIDLDGLNDFSCTVATLAEVALSSVLSEFNCHGTNGW
jgi:hypothetical protein